MESLYVIKIGGYIVDNPTLLNTCLQSFAKVKGQAILVHGGGKMATSIAKSMGVEQTMIEGRRITDEDTLKIVTMVYAGYINKNIVAQLQALGINAMGLSGVDGNLIKAHKRTHDSIDYGFVGDIDVVNTDFLLQLLSTNIKLVVSPITHDGKGQVLNTNADTIAQSLATALASSYNVHIIYGFENEGVLKDINDPSSVIAHIDRPLYATLKNQKIINEGMIPKIDNAYEALDNGVQSVIIGKAEKMNELMNGTSGTIITN
ncbi:MAG: acetylglutamate kinase [Burkholderiaceae bacterium]